MEDKTRLFICYSRKDEQAVMQLVEALERDVGVEVFRDKNDILPSEEWRARLEALIRIRWCPKYVHGRSRSPQS